MKRGDIAEKKETLLLISTEDEFQDNFEEDIPEDNHVESQSKGSKWTTYLTPEEIKEAEKALAFKNKSNFENDNENINPIDDNEAFDYEEDFDCDSYLQMNSVNQENIQQNDSKTFSSTTKRPSNSNNTSQPVQTKKSKWSSFTSTETPCWNSQTESEQPNILQQRTNFPQNNTAKTYNPHTNTAASYLKKSLGGKSFRSSKTSISVQPLLKHVATQPVSTDFAKKFLLNRKQN